MGQPPSLSHGYICQACVCSTAFDLILVLYWGTSGTSAGLCPWNPSQDAGSCHGLQYSIAHYKCFADRLAFGEGA